ncbi:uncharacterized protein LOC135928989 [Gordionus sp. m RMFG-2023]|uniref:uncharacterized protein LOC135928989 n=1 Tax=Gordionus sp. m RMFG-2023 TaxID=3053472 RepID=UPI0031FC1C80
MILCADDLVLLTNNEEELRNKISIWKMTMEAKGLKMNAVKAKVMINGDNLKAKESGKWPCYVRGIEVARNSIQCTRFQKCMHNKCSGKKGSLMLARMTFICRTDGGVDSAVAARSDKHGKSLEISSILPNKNVTLKLKGKVYVSCLRSCLVNGGETLSMKVAHEAKLERTEMRMIRWMCGVSLKELRAIMGIEVIGVVMR